MKTALGTTACIALFASAPPAWAADGPPPGWEVTPTAPKVAVKPIDRCGDNADCHLHQTGLDTPMEATPWVTFEVDVAALPLMKRSEAPKGGAPLSDAPPVRAIDGKGRPFPWTDGAKGEMRVMPPGKLGEVAWGHEWSTPFFEEPRYRSIGYGDTRNVDAKADKPATTLDGSIEYVSFDHLGAGIVYDHVIGKLTGAPQVAATLWEHAEALPLPAGGGHAFRDEREGVQQLVVLLPEVFLDMEGRRTTVHGGFVPGNRFSTDQAFTRYTMPVDAAATGTVMYSILDTQRRRWIAAGDPKTKPPRLETVVIATSRTSVEKAARVVIFTRPRKSDF